MRPTKSGPVSNRICVVVELQDVARAETETGQIYQCKKWAHKAYIEIYGLASGFQVCLSHSYMFFTRKIFRDIPALKALFQTYSNARKARFIVKFASVREKKFRDKNV